MFRTYFKTTWRNLKKHKLHNGINLAGLCIALTCALFIFVYVHHQLSYEKFFKQADQIYRLEYKGGFTGEKKMLYANINSAVNPGPLKSISGVKRQTRFAASQQVPLFVKANHKKLAVSKIWYADSSFFKVFSFHFIAGDRKTALTQPNSVVLSQQTAQKFFGHSRAVGHTLTILSGQKQIPLIVRGVVKVPSNTHLQFHAVTSKAVYKDLYGISLSKVYWAYNYLKLKKGQDPVRIAKEISSMTKRPSGSKINYRLEPISRIHLYSHARGELSPNSNIRYIYFLSVIAFILLIIAGINFMSLATAQNLQRYKEASIRKVLGAYRRQLTGQYLAETAGISLIALVISYIIVYFLLPAFNDFAGASLPFSSFLTPLTLIVFIGGTIILGILAGLYPAVLFSSFRPTRMLKSLGTSGKGGALLWKSIVVIQFAISIAMIICTLTITRQMHYIQQKDLGFNKSNIITFPNYFGGTHYKTFESRIRKLGGVKNVTVSSYIPGTSRTSGTTLVTVPGQKDSLTFYWISTDYNYLKTYGIKLKKGRFFSPEHATDSTQAFVINEAAVKVLHLKTPLGTTITAGNRKGSIIGITKDFNFLSLYQKIPPIVFWMNKHLYFKFSVKLAKGRNLSATISSIEHVFHSVLPNTPFIYQFVDQQYDALYRTDRQMGNIFGTFAVLSLFISCLGLFSLSSFMATRKTKEIGIRKVFGASMQNILSSFYKTYSLLVGIACLFAVPVSYIFLSKWLANYAYRIGMPVWTFAASIAAALIIAWSAVSVESVKASLADPVDSLRSN